MGQGFDGIGAAAVERANRQQQSGGEFMRRFRLLEGGTAVVRFLEQNEEVLWAWCCQLPKRGKQMFGDHEPSLDQTQAGDPSIQCPLVAAGLPRVFRGWINLIWRNAPVYELDGNGRMVKDGSGNYKVVGYADQVAVWESGITVFNTLHQINTKYRGLSSRDFEVTRTGSGLKTTYQIMPADVDGGPVPMTAEDLALAEAKYDLRSKVTPKSRDELLRLLGGQQVAANADSLQSGVAPNPFMS